MTAVCQVRPDYYRDSVFLMRAAQEIRKVSGVLDVGMMMGTAANKHSLGAAGLLCPDAEAAGPGDLIVAVRAQTEVAADAALAAAREHLDAQAGAGGARPAEEATWASLEGAAAADPGANVAMVSVPGPYAAAEAWRALRRGLNVFLFSDNVPLAAEVELKRAGQSADRLVMGPDCGTAIIDGVPLGFANAVPRGPIGVIGASGTGMQAVTCLLARSGIGVSQAIGTGSRDMTAEVGAVSTLQALDLLSRDPGTTAIVLVSKVPSPTVADQVVAALAACGKPGVINFLGYSPAGAAQNSVTYARLLEDVVPQVSRLTGGDWPTSPLEYWLAAEDVAGALQRERSGLSPGQDLIRGLYSGGTLGQEAALVLAGRGLATEPATADSAGSAALPAGAHCIVDLGADEFTVGRPHPMIDLSLRTDLILQCAADPRTALVLFDVVLGFGAHSDPATDLAAAVTAARSRAAADGRALSFVASVCGTEADPQGLRRSEAALKAAGVVLLPTNAQAARFACLAVGQGMPPDDACRVVPWRSASLQPDAARPLFGQACRVINVGLHGFFDTLQEVGAPATQVDWRPPLGGDPGLANRLAMIL